ncbi:MAG: MCE family protein [Fibrobacteria bacterium]|nr:MCE family protein [Fibrobacteria bacterium]
MEKTYRKLGYITCFVVLIVTSVVSLKMASDLLKGPHLVKVQFANVGTLIPQEPVSMDGVNVGEVADIQYAPEAAIVTLEFYKRLSIPKDSRILNFNHSLMGARMIFIERGSSPEPMDFNTLQQGSFDNGIAEMLHQAEALLTMVLKYREVAELFALGKDSVVSFPHFFNKTLRPFFKDLNQTLTDINDVEKDLKEKANLALKFSKEITTLINSNKNTIPDMTRKTQKVLLTTAKILEQTDSLMIKVKENVKLITEDDNLAHKLIYQKEAFKTLEALNNSLNSLVLLLRAEGLSGLINFWTNVNIIGTNPTQKK